MQCPNGCRGYLEIANEGEWDEHLHCGDCGANWTWEEVSEYEMKHEGVITTQCGNAHQHRMRPTLDPRYEMCACGWVMETRLKKAV